MHRRASFELVPAAHPELARPPTQSCPSLGTGFADVYSHHLPSGNVARGPTLPNNSFLSGCSAGLKETKALHFQFVTSSFDRSKECRERASLSLFAEVL